MSGYRSFSYPSPDYAGIMMNFAKRELFQRANKLGGKLPAYIQKVIRRSRQLRANANVSRAYSSSRIYGKSTRVRKRRIYSKGKFLRRKY